MSFDSDDLLARLEELRAGLAGPRRFLVAYSGGIDSSVLLHALATTGNKHGAAVIAVHIDHGLHDEASAWESHCERFAAGLEVQYVSRAVEVCGESGLGLEAAARQARYEAFCALVEEGDWLVSAHHEDDQAETLLLNLMRGSGLAGLAGIGAIQPFCGGMLVRPLLGVSGADLKAYAGALGLSWIDDPSNRDSRFDRNFLRREIIPSLEQRWPGVAQRLGRSAELAGEASELLNDLAGMDFAAVSTGAGPDRLDIDALKSLAEKRQRNVLRYALRQCDLPPAPATRLRQITAELIPAREDAQPLVSWPGVEVRRYRNRLYLLAEASAGSETGSRMITPDGDWIDLGRGRGQMRLEAGVSGGIDGEAVKQGLELRFRRGGEKFCPTGQKRTRKLKKLLQEDGIVPWMRERIPLLFAGDELVAVGDLWIASQVSSSSGYGVQWRNRPSLH